MIYLVILIPYLYYYAENNVYLEYDEYGIRLTEVYEFGIPYEVALANYKTIEQNYEIMYYEIKSWNRYEHFSLWQSEASFYKEVWQCILFALNQNYPIKYRLEKLYRLRDFLGYEDFYYRLLPPLIPNQRVKP